VLDPRTSGWTRRLAAVAGAAVGVLLLYASVYAAVRWGDDVSWLFPDGVLGTASGYALLTLPFVGFVVGLLVAPLLPRLAWLATLVMAGAAVVLLTPLPTINCGGSLTGYTCGGQSSAPSSPGDYG
jgi:uncharacterized membrane protein YhhN